MSDEWYTQMQGFSVPVRLRAYYLASAHVTATSYLAAMSPNQPIPPDDETPPLLGSWRNIYAFVLVLHVALIILFYVFSQLYA